MRSPGQPQFERAAKGTQQAAAAATLGSHNALLVGEPLTAQLTADAVLALVA